MLCCSSVQSLPVMFTGDFMCAEGVAVLSALGCSKGVCLRFGSSNLQVAELR